MSLILGKRNTHTHQKKESMRIWGEDSDIPTRDPEIHNINVSQGNG